MLERVRTAIVNPEKLIRFRKDRLIYAFLYMIFFAALMPTGPLVRMGAAEPLTREVRQDIRASFVFPDSDCAIENARLTCEEPTQHVFYEQHALFGEFKFGIDTTETYDSADFEGHHVILHDETVYLSLDQFYLRQTVREKPISELHADFHNIDFNPETEAEEEAFFEAFFNTLSQEVERLRTLAMGVRFLVEFISAFILFLVFVLLNSFLIQRRFQQVPFKQMLVMMTYASTLAFIVLIFYSLLEFSLIIFLILLFVAFRQTSKLAYEIQKRLSG